MYIKRCVYFNISVNVLNTIHSRIIYNFMFVKYLKYLFFFFNVVNSYFYAFVDYEVIHVF